MKWRKATERLPINEGEYYVKYKTGEKTVLYASGRNHHNRWLALVDEWLDETLEIDGGSYENSKSTEWRIFKDDEVNSILAISLRLLSNDKMVALRDALIERTTESPSDSEAVEFAEWATGNYEKPAWSELWFDERGVGFSTEHIYNLFKSTPCTTNKHQ